MVTNETNEFAEEILNNIQYSVKAHHQYPKTIDDTVRFWDRKTPYIIHPTWCAMTLLTETSLSEDTRRYGYQVLLWHDVFEDTNLDSLPKDTPERVIRCVKEMTFSSFSEEVKAIWSKDSEIRLLKLYDKVSNLLDGIWMKDKKWNDYVNFTIELSKDVQLNYGDLNIIKIASAVAIVRI